MEWQKKAAVIMIVSLLIGFLAGYLVWGAQVAWLRQHCQGLVP